MMSYWRGLVATHLSGHEILPSTPRRDLLVRIHKLVGADRGHSGGRGVRLAETEAFTLTEIAVLAALSRIPISGYEAALPSSITSTPQMARATPRAIRGVKGSLKTIRPRTAVNATPTADQMP